MRRVWQRARTALSAGAALWLLWIVPAHAERVAVVTTEVGHWSIRGFNDENPMCAASISNGTTSLVFDYIAKDGYALNLLDDTGRWRPVDGQSYTLNATLTGEEPITVESFGWQNRLIITLGADDSALDAFRNGGVLAFETAAHRFQIDLQESSRAFSALRDCVKEIFGNDGGSSAHPVSPQPSPAYPPSDEQTAVASAAEEARRVGAFMLNAAGVYDAEFVSNAATTGPEPHDANWTMQGVTARLVLRLDLEPEQSDAMIDDIIDTLAQSCPDGELRTSRPEVAPPLLGRLRARCGDGDLYAAYFILVRRPKGGTYVWTVTSEHEPIPAKRASDFADRLAAALAGQSIPEN
jgi:hypothetical protein